MTKEELLELFNKITAPASGNEGIRYITQRGFLLAAQIISSKSFRDGMVSGFEQIEGVMNMDLVKHEAAD